MLTRTSTNAQLTEIQKLALERTLKHLKPLNLIFIERIHTVGLFKNLPLSVICLFIALILYFPGYFWLIPHLTSGVDTILSLLTFLVGIGYIFLPLIASKMLFKLASDGLLKIVGSTNSEEIMTNVHIWAEKFSVGAQIKIMLLFAILLAAANLLALEVQFGETPLVVIGSLWLGRFFWLIVGNTLHFYLKLSST